MLVKTEELSFYLYAVPYYIILLLNESVQLFICNIEAMQYYCYELQLLFIYCITN